MTKLDSILKSRGITLSTKVHLVKAMVFPMVMCGCESWTVKKAERQRIDDFELWCGEKTLESPLACKEIQPVHPKGDQSWVFIGRTNAEAETPVLWSPHAKSWLIGKDPDAGKDWGKEKGMTEDEMAGWHYRLNGHGFGWTPDVGDGQGGLACCDSWGRKELDMTEWLNWTEVNNIVEHLFMFYILSLEKCLDLLPIFDQVVWFLLLLLSCMSYLCILVIKFLLVMPTCQPSHFSHVWLFVTPGTVACQAPLSMVFSRQEYWSGLPCSPPGHLPNPGIKLMAPSLQADSLPLSHQGSPLSVISFANIFSHSIGCLFI